MTTSGVNLDMIVCKGGVDQITPTLTLANTFARNMLNYECAVTGGYSRIAGYERFDGHKSPTDESNSGVHPFVYMASYVTTPVAGDAITTNGGASGTVAYVNGLMFAVAKETGTWEAGDIVSKTGPSVIGTITSIAGIPSTPREYAVAKQAIANIYRASISAIPGVGPVRGVVEYNDIVYGFRNNANESAVDVWKSTSTGWTQVAMFKTVSFTAGTTEPPAEGATLTKGTVTATIKRVVLESGAWSAGTAAGRIIITTPAGGNFSSGAATSGTTAVTLSGAQSSVALAPHTTLLTKFEFEERNFSGQSATVRLYGCDGVNNAFEFDGTVLVPIKTGAATDTPVHLTVHKNHLFLSVGSSVMHSAPGLPYDFTALSGAGEIATGGVITGMIVMPGDANGAALAVFNRSNTHILYGSSVADWKLVTYNSGTGAVDYSAQNLAQTFAFDDRGANAIQTSLQYGNFVQSTITNAVLPFINQRIDKVTCATLCRRKSQYRVFFNDKWGLFITIVNGKLLGCAPVYFPDQVFCAYEGKKNDGTDVIYFGSADGMIYKMESGTSFDGEPIDFNLVMNYSAAKSPRTLKRYRKCVPEISADSGTYAEFKVSYMLGHDSAEYSQYGNDSYDPYIGRNRWDDFVWDNFFWDTKGPAPVECYMEGTAENAAVMVSGSSDYVPPFTINSFLVHYSPRRLMR